MEVAASKKKSFLRLNGGLLVPKLEYALFYIDIDQYFLLLLVPTSHLHTLRQRFPRQTRTPIRNRAGLGVISRELVDQGVVQGCGFDSGTHEARFSIPRTLNLLDIPESTTHFGWKV